MPETAPITKPLISIIIPVHNLESYLAKCFDSALVQTYQNIEVIVVNDGSTDNSLKIIEEYAARDPRVVVLNTHQQGVSLARKIGIEKAHGKYITFLDGDDYFEPDIISTLHEGLVAGGYDIVCCNSMRVRESYSMPLREKHNSVKTGYDYLEAVLAHYIWVTVWGKLYKRELFEGLIGHPALRLGEDTVVNMQVGLKQPKVGFIDYIGYNYYQRSDSANHKRIDLAYCTLFSDSVIRVLEMHRAEIGDRIELYILLNKIRWFRVYIRKSGNKWIGNSDYAMSIYRLLKKYKKEVHHYVPCWDLIMIRIYRYRILKPIMRAITFIERLKTSAIRRIRSWNK